jgi:pimeloyl-ACP methyl ester carboxylesterase
VLRADGDAVAIRCVPPGDVGWHEGAGPKRDLHAARYETPISLLQMFSPATLNNDAAISMWLDVYEMTAARRSAASGQRAIELLSDQRDALRAVPVPCRVIAFSDDLVCPPHLCAEVAEAIPDCDYVEIGSCGHLGYLERPDDVNSSMIEFLDKY